MRSKKKEVQHHRRPTRRHRIRGALIMLLQARVIRLLGIPTQNAIDRVFSFFFKSNPVKIILKSYQNDRKKSFVNKLVLLKI